MKKHILLLALLALAPFARAESTKIKETAEGLRIGSAATQKIGFYGATPVVKGTGVTATGAVLATLTKSSATITYLGVDGSTNEVSVLTNVTINTVAGFTTTNQANGIVNVIRNTGLAGN